MFQEVFFADRLDTFFSFVIMEKECLEVLDMTLNQARESIKANGCAEIFGKLYGEGAEAQKTRYLSALDAFENLFGNEKEESSRIYTEFKLLDDNRAT